MAPKPFHPRLDDLPALLPVFPLPGVILLPRAQLPLNVFEPRYLAMTADALGAGRLLGMLQPDPAAGGERLCRVGCAGRITAFSETEDGRMRIVLTGVCRFEAGEEAALLRGYRRVAPEWRPFAADLEDPGELALGAVDLLGLLRRYAEVEGLEPDLAALAGLEAEALVSALSMNLPLSPGEKQGLLEAPTFGARVELLATLLDWRAGPRGRGTATVH